MSILSHFSFIFQNLEVIINANVIKYYCQAWLQWMAMNKQSNSSLGFDSKECLFLLIYCRSGKCLSLFWFYSLQLSVLLFNVHFNKYWTWINMEERERLLFIRRLQWLDLVGIKGSRIYYNFWVNVLHRRRTIKLIKEES